MKNIFSILLFLVIVSTNSLFAQNDPHLIINEAKNYYQLGQSDLAYKTLKPVLGDKKMIKELSKQEKFDLYKTAAASCFLINKKDSACFYTDEMLRYKPHYLKRYNANDLPEMKFYYNQYEIKHTFSVGLNFGFALTSYDITNIYSSFSSTAHEEESETQTSFGIGLTAEYNFYKNFALEIKDESYFSNKHSFIWSPFFESSLKYYIPIKKTNLFIYPGAGVFVQFFKYSFYNINCKIYHTETKDNIEYYTYSGLQNHEDILYESPKSIAIPFYSFGIGLQREFRGNIYSINTNIKFIPKYDFPTIENSAVSYYNFTREQNNNPENEIGEVDVHTHKFRFTIMLSIIKPLTYRAIKNTNK